MPVALLIRWHRYLLFGMQPDMWDNHHPAFGAPDTIVGKYLGSMSGNRVWHGFEIWRERKEVGVLFMTQDDLDKLTVTDLGEV